METLINNYGRLIDKIRKDRNKSRQELCEDIMSVRNFQRFANGEVSVSHDKIIQLIDRLNLDYFTFNQMYKSTLEDEYNKIRKAFNLAVNWQFDEALLEFSKIDKDKLLGISIMMPVKKPPNRLPTTIPKGITNIKYPCFLISLNICLLWPISIPIKNINVKRAYSVKVPICIAISWGRAKRPTPMPVTSAKIIERVISFFLL